MQHDMDCVYNWWLEYKIPISLEKSSVLHLGANNLCRRCTCGNFALPIETACNNLGILHTVDDSYYSSLVANIVQKARQIFNTSLRATSSCNPIFLLNIYLAYFKPTLDYASQI